MRSERIAGIALWYGFLFAWSVTSVNAEARRVSYEITAEYNPKEHQVKGSELLTWLNNSPEEIKELWFHLYMNAFKNNESTFIIESGGRSRSFRIREGRDAWGWVEIERLEIPGIADLTNRIEYKHPDDDNVKDETVIRVPLEEGVRPGSTVTLRITFTTKFPKVFARTGYHGKFLMAGQWFPKICVLEVPGQRGADITRWNCHQFHENSEFYADYGFYRVHITVPSEYRVGATGVLMNRSLHKGGKLTTYTFEQDNVHDFAWAASPDFLVKEKKFIPDEWVSVREYTEMSERLNVPVYELKLRPVRMILMLQPDHASQAERYFKALGTALKYFGLWYGAYPYNTITVVDPPYGGQGAGGMEYPTLITTGTTWLSDARVLLLEMVTIHEFGHQYWYGMVGSNEFEESWLDEGFNTYSTSQVLDQVYGPSRGPLFLLHIPLTWFFRGISFTQMQANRAQYLSLPDVDYVVRPAWTYYNTMSYGINSYARTGVLLRTLENILGEETMARVMRNYFQTWKFRHPSSWDFIQTVNRVSGRNVEWFFNRFVFSEDILDYAVDRVNSEKVRTPEGFFGHGKDLKYVSKDEATKMEKKKGEGDHSQYRSEVVVRRRGKARGPVKIEFRFDDGKVIRDNWNGSYPWTQFVFIRPSPLREVVIDPEVVYLLDTCFANNSYRMDVKLGPTLKFSSHILFWVQNLLMGSTVPF